MRESPDAVSVVLNIGADLGALVVYVTAAERGREIEISRRGGPRIRAVVHERGLAHDSIYCAVYDGLVAGEYQVWRDPHAPAGTVTLRGGQVAQVDWTGRP